MEMEDKLFNNCRIAHHLMQPRGRAEGVNYFAPLK